jgi:hypothetical protein
MFVNIWLIRALRRQLYLSCRLLILLFGRDKLGKYISENASAVTNRLILKIAPFVELI